LLGQAAKILSGRGDWMTVGGIAEALQADEWTTSKVLESLTDSGRVQEAKAQNGQTVYRYAR
jgi:predicted transcriptional regulator